MKISPQNTVRLSEIQLHLCTFAWLIEDAPAVARSAPNVREALESYREEARSIEAASLVGDLDRLLNLIAGRIQPRTPEQRAESLAREVEWRRELVGAKAVQSREVMSAAHISSGTRPAWVPMPVAPPPPERLGEPAPQLNFQQRNAMFLEDVREIQKLGRTVDEPQFRALALKHGVLDAYPEVKP